MKDCKERNVFNFWPTLMSLPTHKARVVLQVVASALIMVKSSEVDQLYEQLREKHKENRMCGEEQLRMWAYLINMGKHASLDEPPDKSFWRGRKRPITEAENQVTTKICRMVSSSSPSTKVSMRTQLIDQLEKWKKFHTDGIIDDRVQGAKGEYPY